MDLARVEALRAQTPGCGRSAHFNHAGASLPSEATLAVIADHLRHEAIVGPMEAGAEATGRVETARAAAATLLNASSAEVAFASSGSAAWGLAFAALPPLRAGDRILVGRHEWGGNLATLLEAARRAEAHLEVIPCRDDGSVDPEALAAMIDDRVKLVSLTWLPANGGLINDAAAIGRVTRAAGVPYFVDAGQALGQLPVDVRAIGCDVLKGAGRKHLRGPRGTALLYLRSAFMRTLRPAFLDVLSAPMSNAGVQPRGDARLFETSEASIALQLGLGEALRQALDVGVGATWRRVIGLSNELRSRLGEVESVTIRDLGAEQSGLVSFTVAGLSPSEVRTRLAERGFAVSANGPAYTPLDMKARGLDGVVRASVSYLNTEAEIAQLTQAVAVLPESGR